MQSEKQITDTTEPINAIFERKQFSERLVILKFLPLAGALISFTYAILFEFYFNYRLASQIVLMHSFLYLFTYVFIHFNLFKTARHFLSINFFIEITVHALYLFPKETNFQLYYLIAMPLIYLLFTNAQIKSRFVYSFLSVFALISIELFEPSLQSSFLIISEHLEVIKNYNVISSLSVLSVAIFLFANLMETAEKKSRQQAITDPLTKLYNRRHFFELSSQMVLLNKRNGLNFSIIFLDLDLFKNINDIHGHDIGDKVLQKVASTLKENIRSTDIVARFGGEEFVILFSDTQLNHAMAKAEAIRIAISNCPMPIAALKITASIGVSCITDNDKNINEVLIRADKALYFAKNQGRNVVKKHIETNNKPSPLDTHKNASITNIKPLS